MVAPPPFLFLAIATAGGINNQGAKERRRNLRGRSEPPPDPGHSPPTKKPRRGVGVNSRAGRGKIKFSGQCSEKRHKTLACAPEYTQVVREDNRPALAGRLPSATFPAVSDISSIPNTWTAVRNHSRQYAEFTFVYPVISRRSRGLSIGVNLNPDKVCNFNCVYCEVDRRTPPRANAVDRRQLREELQTLIRGVKDGGLAGDPRFAGVPDPVLRDIRDIAFSGDGEPTMLSGFSDCVQLVADVRSQESLAATKIVLITNAAGLDKADVRRGLEILDANNGQIWGKLDAGTEAYFRSVNRSNIRFDRILKNLTETARVRPIVIQSLFLRVRGLVMPPEELEAYCRRLREITSAGGRILAVHAYTVARPTPEPYATRLEAAELESLAATIRARTGLPVDTFA